ncbi:Cyclic nucleotide-gated cation channel like [Actinidia chinensis var. chinensis]|uniref:Cyclic nucleotide-gated cation channel like n=1 Tax=Actinidia chinensis var. chinensis TaxID=1590841 RepID=A0A2R6QEC2_ACTCC|nr:Cyclic nucleotide-gated cation channel like [Actinidia chinensis var. chinensis]
MDVCTAFAFVLNANTTRKYVGSGSLTQETQITSSVLGNLLDVIEEVQAARVELQNLAYTSFCSPSVERLELHLHFIDFKSGRKVALALDMSCLKWGIYPSEAKPSLLEGPAIASRKPFPEPLSAEIRSVTQTLKAGYSRIICLCRCVSQVVQAWNG